MRKMPIIVAGFALASGLVLPSSAAQPFKMNAGLWEMSITMQTMTPDPTALSKMTRLQRERMPAAMADAVAKLPPSHYRECITPQELYLGIDPKHFSTKSCKRTVDFRSSTFLDGSEVCSGDPNLSGTFHLRIINPRWLELTYDGVLSHERPVAKVMSKAEGRWLRADCREPNDGAR